MSCTVPEIDARYIDLVVLILDVACDLCVAQENLIVLPNDNLGIALSTVEYIFDCD